MRDIQPLIQYVQQNRSAGVDDEITKNTLMQDGTWSKEEIVSALNHGATETMSELSQNDVKSNPVKVAALVVFMLLVVMGGVYAVYSLNQPEQESSKIAADETNVGVENTAAGSVVVEQTEEVSEDVIQPEPTTHDTEINNSEPKVEKVVTEAPQTALYATTKTEGVPYLCKYSVVSFWEELDYFEAQILGDDFYSKQVPSPLDLERQEKYGMDPMAYTRFVKKEGQVYLWMKPQEESLDSAGYKFRYDEIESFIKSQDSSFTHFQYPGLLVEPSPNSECERIESASIVIPNLQFVDITENIKSGEVSLEPTVTTSTGTTN